MPHRLSGSSCSNFFYDRQVLPSGASATGRGWQIPRSWDAICKKTQKVAVCLMGCSQTFRVFVSLFCVIQFLQVAAALRSYSRPLLFIENDSLTSWFSVFPADSVKGRMPPCRFPSALQCSALKCSALNMISIYHAVRFL